MIFFILINSKDEAVFSVESALDQSYDWSDKYRPRKPRLVRLELPRKPRFVRLE